MENGNLTRRSLLKTAALVSTALAAPFVRGAFAAGKLACGFWDHWVPRANDTLTKLCKDWGDQQKVDVAIDYITSQGDKNLLTIAAEAQSHSGHDILAFPTWYAAGNADNLEPVDDIVNDLIQKHGKVTAAVEYSASRKASGSPCRRLLAARRNRPARGSTCSSSMSESI
jgi:ABC-type glycerol-3-phosphate transport system substrate-binding protein